MADPEVRIVKKAKTIHYGSLEEKERQRLQGLGPGISGSDGPSTSGATATTETRKTVDLEDDSFNQVRNMMLQEIERN